MERAPWMPSVMGCCQARLVQILSLQQQLLRVQDYNSHVMPENQWFILPASFTSSTPFPVTCPEPCMRWWRGSMYKWAFNRHLFSVFWQVMSLHTLHWLLQKQTKTKSYPDKTYNTSNGQKSYFSGKHFDRYNLSTQQNNSLSFPALYVNLHWISYLCYEFLNFYLFI